MVKNRASSTKKKKISSSRRTTLGPKAAPNGEAPGSIFEKIKLTNGSLHLFFHPFLAYVQNSNGKMKRKFVNGNTMAKEWIISFSSGRYLFSYSLSPEFSSGSLVGPCLFSFLVPDFIHEIFCSGPLQSEKSPGAVDSLLEWHDSADLCSAVVLATGIGSFWLWYWVRKKSDRTFYFI
jgi:hypothetical protein